MVTDKLKTIMAKAQLLSPAEQDALAAEIEVLLDEREWDRQFADPRSELFFAKMKEELEAEKAAGTLEECE